jgi:hypothetical protein
LIITKATWLYIKEDGILYQHYILMGFTIDSTSLNFGFLQVSFLSNGGKEMILGPIYSLRAYYGHFIYQQRISSFKLEKLQNDVSRSFSKEAFSFKWWQYCWQTHLPAILGSVRAYVIPSIVIAILLYKD